MTTVVATRSLTKFYGRTRGIEEVDLDVLAGEVFGFLGPNGAGKSTTIRLLLDLLRPTRGQAWVFGLDVRADSIDIRRRVGYLPGELALYERMTGIELMRYLGAVRGMSGLGDTEMLAERFEIDLGQRIRTYSTGNRQKIGLVQAFMHRPELLILDEPTRGLDPIVRQEFYSLIGEARDEGRTIFLSSHVLPEVERIADRVAIIRRGGIVAIEEVAALKRRARRRLEMRFATPVSTTEFSSLASVQDAAALDGGSVLLVTVEGSVDSVIKQAAKHELTNIVTHEGDLEEAFLGYYQEAGDAS